MRRGHILAFGNFNNAAESAESEPDPRAVPGYRRHLTKARFDFKIAEADLRLGQQTSARGRYSIREGP